MASTKIDELDWLTIIGRIEKGLCVPFLGAAANVTSDKYEGLPLGADLALHMIGTITDKDVEEIKTELKELKNIGVIKKLLDSPDYNGLARLALQDLTRVAMLVRYKTDFDMFISLLKSFVPDTKREPSALLNTLARIPMLKLIVTTNYDRLMERALDEANEHPEVIVQRLRGFNDEEQEEVRTQMIKPDARIIYKMHGTFLEEKAKDDEAGVTHENGGQREAVTLDGNESELAAQLIIGEDDYIQFLTVIGKAKVGVPDPIKARITDSTLLFLGYGLEDWDFRTIHKGLIETLPVQRKRRSFAIQKDPSELMVRFWEKKEVQIYNMDLYEFSEQLKDRCQKAQLYKDPKPLAEQ
jgi:hypothetical protein